MVNKGIIVNINKNGIVVMDDHSGYVKLKLKEGHKIGQTIYFTELDKLTKSEVSLISRIGLKRLAYVALLMIALMSASQLSSFMPVEREALVADSTLETATAMQDESVLRVASIVTVDINPSVKLMLDAVDQVIHIKALNEDAMTLSLNDLIGISVEDAVVQIVNRAKAAGFIDVDNLDEDYVLITTVPAKGKLMSFGDSFDVELDEDKPDEDEFDENDVNKMNQLRAKIEEKIADNPELQDVNVAIIKATIVEMRKAEQKHVPVGLYVAKGKVSTKDDSGNEMEVTVREYFSNHKNVEQFKEKGKIIEKRDEAKIDLAKSFISKLDKVGVDTTTLKAKLESEDIDIDQLLIEIKALWADAEKNVKPDVKPDEKSDEAETSPGKPNESGKSDESGKPSDTGKPGETGKPNDTGKTEGPGNSNKGNN